MSNQKGVSLTPSHRAAIAAALTGKKLSPETRAKIGAAQVGRPRSAETRARVAAGLTGRPVSPETREKIAAARRGQSRPHTPEARAKISAALRLRIRSPHTPAAKAKMSAASMGNRSIRNASIKGECVYCGEPAQTHDHLMPTSRGGLDTPDNLVLACFTCNRTKNKRTPEEWLASMIGDLD